MYTLLNNYNSNKIKICVWKYLQYSSASSKIRPVFAFSSKSSLALHAEYNFQTRTEHKVEYINEFRLF